MKTYFHQFTLNSIGDIITPIRTKSHEAQECKEQETKVPMSRVDPRNFASHLDDTALLTMLVLLCTTNMP